LGAVACAGQTSAPRPAPGSALSVLVTQPAPRATETSAPVVGEAEHPVAIDDESAPCSWKALIERSDWTHPFPLRLRPGEPPFVRSVGGVFAARFESGSPTMASVTHDSGGVVLHALAEARDLVFFSARPLTLGGFVRLHSSARLSLPSHLILLGGH